MRSYALFNDVSAESISPDNIMKPAFKSLPGISQKEKIPELKISPPYFKEEERYAPPGGRLL